MKTPFVNLTKCAFICFVMSIYNQCHSTQLHFAGNNEDNVSSRESNNWFHVDTQKWNYMKYFQPTKMIITCVKLASKASLLPP